MLKNVNFSTLFCLKLIKGLNEVSLICCKSLDFVQKNVNYNLTFNYSSYLIFSVDYLREFITIIEGSYEI
jgi:hypothetical protein